MRGNSKEDPVAEVRPTEVTEEFGDKAVGDGINLTAKDKELVVSVGPSGWGMTRRQSCG
jgi:ABC-type sugar transport system ATPase subunit